jgi:hypothetical protein
MNELAVGILIGLLIALAIVIIVGVIVDWKTPTTEPPWMDEQGA